MSEIVQRASFVPEATWLISWPGERITDDCGTIQGVVQLGGWGAVQNVGVAPEYRGLGLGRALVLRSLHGFRQAGVPRVYLEVTARNTPAVALYRSVGFRLSRTTYKAVERPTAAYAVL
jgi:ribosomal protein S18 acetylase RimI-like enzyme